ncbi:hypothetical protein JCM10908_003255 [Rhodotorula pacifica]|uniref:uncharacterized protein n=1 Tax=Rhodotorula pacifica TaxID=1495444 RepID=UPI00317E4AE0
MTKATLYYDIVSPWSFMAYSVLKRYRQPWDMQLELKPMFLGGVMQASGNKPPITVKNKGLWMNGSDLPLAFDFIKVDFTFPKQFPINTINMMRALRAIQQIAPEKLEKATDAFYAAFWQPKPSDMAAMDAVKPDAFPKILSKDGLFSEAEIKRIVEAANSDEIKNLVKEESSKLAADGGAFGFPWIVVTRDDGKERNFFGSDRFEQIAYWLGKEWKGPLADGGKRPMPKL